MADKAPGGRPKGPEPGSSVSTWLRQSEHDRLIRIAQQQDTTISKLVREMLRVKLR